MGKKRLVIDLDESEHTELVAQARHVNMTLANYIRNAVDLPLQRQGVKAPPAATLATVAATVAAVKANKKKRPGAK